MWSATTIWWVLVVAVVAEAEAHPTGEVTSCPVVDRSEWGANPPVVDPRNLTLPVPFVVIHHSYIPSACDSREPCVKAMRSMQYMHQTVHQWNDIGYNFAIGSDGQVYEGRGWDVVGAHAPKYNFMSIGICFIGDYRTEAPPAPMLEAAQRLILCGINQGSIDTNYTLVGHKQVRETECPGGALFQVIQQWLHWKPIRDIQPRVKPRLSNTTDQSASDTGSKPALALSTDQSASDTAGIKTPPPGITDQPTSDTQDNHVPLHNPDQSAVSDSKPNPSTNDQLELGIGTGSHKTTGQSTDNTNNFSSLPENKTVTPPLSTTTSNREPPSNDETAITSTTRVDTANDETSNTVDVSSSEINYKPTAV